MIVIAIIACVFISAKYFKFDSILTFWIAYVLTRPLGASLGDLMSQPKSLGGFGLGATVTSIIFLSAILVVVLFLSLTKRDKIENEKTQVTENHATSKSLAVQVCVIACVFTAAGIFIGSYASNHNKYVKDKNDLSGELAGFISTENDMRGYVVANDFKDAKAKADNLEHDWDSQEGTLRPQNQSQWTEIDATFDQVLTAVRTTNNIEKCKSVIDNSLAVLIKINSTSPDKAQNPPAKTQSQEATSTQQQTQSIISNTSKTVSLRDLSSFIKIEKDTLVLVNNGDLARAKTRVKDLETAWDNAQANLQPKNSEKWTQIDGTIDTVLSKLRASHPSQADCKSALQTSISVMQQ